MGLQVRGPTVWRSNRLRWKTKPPIPVSQVPLDYARAHGGTLLDKTGVPADFYAENPAGTGFATSAALEGLDEWPAQQIGELGEFMAGGDPTVLLSVRGFGPVAKSWTPRQALAGTFDEHWRRTRHPRMPDDYDFGFRNAAPSALQVRPYLRGDEVIRLTGLDPRPEPLVLPLPGVGLDLRLTGDATAEKAMGLDTVALDITGKPVLDLTWRAAIADPETYAVAEIGAHALAPAPAPQPEGV